MNPVVENGLSKISTVVLLVDHQAMAIGTKYTGFNIYIANQSIPEVKRAASVL